MSSYVLHTFVIIPENRFMVIYGEIHTITRMSSMEEMTEAVETVEVLAAAAKLVIIMGGMLRMDFENFSKKTTLKIWYND